MRRLECVDFRIVLCVGVGIAVTCMTGLPIASAQGEEEEEPGIERRLNIVKEEGIGGRGNDGPAEGTVAPDFSLTPLKFYEFKIDEKEITEDNAGDLYKPISLSDFKDKKPVVLIFGSYT